MIRLHATGSWMRATRGRRVVAERKEDANGRGRENWRAPVLAWCCQSVKRWTRRESERGAAAAAAAAANESGAKSMQPTSTTEGDDHDEATRIDNTSTVIALAAFPDRAFSSTAISAAQQLEDRMTLTYSQPCERGARVSCNFLFGSNHPIEPLLRQKAKEAVRQAKAQAKHDNLIPCWSRDECNRGPLAGRQLVTPGRLEQIHGLILRWTACMPKVPRPCVTTRQAPCAGGDPSQMLLMDGSDDRSRTDWRASKGAVVVVVVVSLRLQLHDCRGRDPESNAGFVMSAWRSDWIRSRYPRSMLSLVLKEHHGRHPGAGSGEPTSLVWTEWTDSCPTSHPLRNGSS